MLMKITIWYVSNLAFNSNKVVLRKESFNYRERLYHSIGLFISTNKYKFLSILLNLDPAKPNISAEVMKHAGINELFYYCDLIPEPDTDYNYTINWFITNETVTKSKLLSLRARKLDKEFRTSTSLTESHLKSKGIHRFPYAVRNISSPFSEINEPVYKKRKGVKAYETFILLS